MYAQCNQSVKENYYIVLTINLDRLLKYLNIIKTFSKLIMLLINAGTLKFKQAIDNFLP